MYLWLESEEGLTVFFDAQGGVPQAVHLKRRVRVGPTAPFAHDGREDRATMVRRVPGEGESRPGN